MRVQNKYRLMSLTALAGTALGVGIAVVSAQPNGPAGAADVAVSSDVNNHIHAFAIRTGDLQNALNTLGDRDAPPLDSSSGYDQGYPDGVPHAHGLRIAKDQLQRLANGESISLESEENLGHRHTFQFLNANQCPAITQPVQPLPSPTDTPSPGPSASPSPSPSVSINPQPTFTILGPPTGLPTAAS
jgi:hypothetical protein